MNKRRIDKHHVYIRTNVLNYEKRNLARRKLVRCHIINIIKPKPTLAITCSKRVFFVCFLYILYSAISVEYIRFEEFGFAFLCSRVLLVKIIRELPRGNQRMGQLIFFYLFPECFQVIFGI